MHRLHPLPRVARGHHLSPDLLEERGWELWPGICGVRRCPLAVSLEHIRGERPRLDESDLETTTAAAVSSSAEDDAEGRIPAGSSP